MTNVPRPGGPLRILIVSALFPPDAGGPATYVPVMARELTRRGHAVTVLAVTDRPPGEEYGFPLLRLRRDTFKPWRVIRTVANIMALGRRSDVVFVNGLALEAALARFFVARPFVHKVVGDLAWERASVLGWVRAGFEEFQFRRFGLRAEILRTLRSWWTRRADRVVVPGWYLAKWVEGWGYPGDRISVVHNGVDGGTEPDRTAASLATPRTVVTVARLVPWKHVDLILEAVRPYPRLGLLVVGDGPEEGRLRARAKDLGLDGRVRFAGRRSKEETLRLMASCDVFVLYSTYEGLPHVVLEAMTLGLPVVASAAGGTCEVVQDGKNGRLVPPLDADALGRALAEVADGPDRGRLAAAARDTAARFSVGAMVRGTEHVLREAVRRWRPGRY
jgi:glycosyltransferase involved in cell wall biosynthesis